MPSQKKIALIFFLLLIPACFVIFSNTAKAECAAGESCVPACAPGFTQTSNTCNVDVPGIEFSAGVCCKQNPQTTPNLSCSGGKGTCTNLRTGADTGLGNCPGNADNIGQDTCTQSIWEDNMCCVPKSNQQQTNAAQTNQNPVSSSATPVSSSTGGLSLVPCGTSTNPAPCTLCHLILGFKRIFDFLLGLLFIATMLIITVAGVFYMVSSGSKGMMDKAKKALTYGLLAFVIGMGSWLFVNIVMQMVGYQHPTGGNWWQFTCDTAQTRGPAVTSAGSTLAGGATSNQSGQTNKAQGDGSCGGAKDIVEDSKNCDKTSQALDTLLACIKSGMNTTSSSSGASNYFPFKIEKVFAAGNLSIGIGIDQSSHTDHSCHYGGLNCQGQANAADLHGDLPAIRDAAIACGADTVMYDRMAYFGGNSQPFAGNGGGDSAHVRHVHVSVNNSACVCDYLKNS